MTPSLEYVTGLAKQAGQMILDAGTKQMSIKEKASYSDLVTETDVAVEKFLIGQIKEKYPDHKFHCEETTKLDDPITSEPTWLIDPIDGTANFVHTNPDHCVSIGFAINKEVVLGVVYIPHRNRLYSAEKGKGATCNGQPIHVSDQTRSLNQALVSTGFMVGFLHKSDAHPEARKAFRQTMLKNFESLLDHSLDIRRYGSAATDLCMVANGQVDAYAEIGVRAYDYSGSKIIVEEAGGVVVDYDGEPLKLGGRHCIAASSLKLAQELASHLNKSPIPDTDY